MLGLTTTSAAALSRVSGLEDTGPDAVVFAEDVRTLVAAMTTSAGLILARSVGTLPDDRVLVVKDPRYAFAVCARALSPVRTEGEIHPSAVVDPSAKLGERVKIGARAVVEANVILGDDVDIASGALILRGGSDLQGAGFQNIERSDGRRDEHRRGCQPVPEPHRHPVAEKRPHPVPGDAPGRLAQQLSALAILELPQERLEILGRRLLEAFEPQQP